MVLFEKIMELHFWTEHSDCVQNTMWYIGLPTKTGGNPTQVTLINDSPPYSWYFILGLFHLKSWQGVSDIVFCFQTTVEQFSTFFLRFPVIFFFDGEKVWSDHASVISELFSDHAAVFFKMCAGHPPHKLFK